MPPKKKCWTKPKKDGGTYTTCKEGQDKPKKTEEPKKKIKFKVKPKEEKKEEKKEEPKKKRVFHVRGKAKAKPANKPQHAKVIEPKKRVANVAKVIPATKSTMKRVSLRLYGGGADMTKGYERRGSDVWVNDKGHVFNNEEFAKEGKRSQGDVISKRHSKPLR